jgi:hypothetical protein
MYYVTILEGKKVCVCVCVCWEVDKITYGYKKHLYALEFVIKFSVFVF